MAADDESTLNEANEESSTFALSGSMTDGDYVVWRNSSVSVHQQCSLVLAARLDDREAFNVTEVADGSALAVDDGYLIAETPAAQCQDNDPETLTAGIFLIDLATGESTALADDADNVTHIAIDYPYVAWITRDELDYGFRQTVWALDASTDGAPIEVNVDDVGPDDNVYLSLEGDTVYWIDPQGSGARATIGGSTTYVTTLYDTTELVLDEETMVPLTLGRPLYHDLSNGQTRWLGDEGAQYLATDGRYVFWTNAEGNPAITGYDTLTNARFKVWEASSDDPNQAGRIIDINARDGGLAWTRYAYNQFMTAIHGALVEDRLPSAYQPDPGTTSPDWSYYPETGHYLANDFRDFWINNGGLPVFGFPLTEEFDYLSPETEVAYSAQMTERQRFEWHPENAGTPYTVLLGRLGVTILEQQGRDWNLFEKADPSADHYLAETGHAIAPEFWNYWSTHGLDLGHAGVSFDESLALFGYPLSEPMMETNADGDTVLTQYFERAVFESHPDNPAPSQVLLRRLGAELIESWNW